MALKEARTAPTVTDAEAPVRPSVRRLGAAAALVGVALALAGCESGGTGAAAPADGPVTQAGPIIDPQGPFGPARLPSYAAGDRYVFDNPREVWTIKAVGAESVTWSSDRGGERVTPRDPLLPSLRTATPDVGRITRAIQDRSGELWPLSVGNESNYVVAVEVEGQGSQALAWSCRVVGTDRVQVPAGTFNTYKVACARSDGLRLNTYYSPTVGYFVRREVTTAERETQTRSLVAVDNRAVADARQPGDPTPAAAPAAPARSEPLPPPARTSNVPQNQALPPASAPQPAPAASMPASAAPASVPAPAPAGAWTGAGVRLASYSSRQTAERGWERLRSSYPALLGQRAPRLETVTLDGRGTFHRLYAGPYASADEARALCGRIPEMGSVCDVKVFN